jgi:hypothetical protein
LDKVDILVSIVDVQAKLSSEPVTVDRVGSINIARRAVEVSNFTVFESDIVFGIVEPCVILVHYYWFDEI